MVLTLALLLGVCAAACDKDEAPASYGPAAVEQAGLRVLAETDGQRYLVHTAAGDLDFLAGVNLPASIPGYRPEDLAISAGQYSDWFEALKDVGVRLIRIRSIQPPPFYDELLDHNKRNSDNPLYLSIGVDLPHVQRLAEVQNLFDPEVTQGFQAELADAVAAAHGGLQREPLPGRAHGAWTSDISEWVIGWMPGIDLAGEIVQNTDALNADAPAHTGQYFTSTAEASPSERWLAARMDALATAEAGYGNSVPVGFINWPTTDPLAHPYDPAPRNDLASLDANHIQPTAAWPGGTFAVYDAYPYYPDFLRHEPELQQFQYAGEADPYAGYLAALVAHHAEMPVVIGESGLPSSVGSSHVGPLARDQGGHSEQATNQNRAELIRMQRDLGLAGGFLFSLQDEWDQQAWNTAARQLPAGRHQLWQDPWTSEQHYGLWATDGQELGSSTLARGKPPVHSLSASWDHSWVHLTLQLGRAFASPVRIGFDVVAGGPYSGRLPGASAADSASDYAVVFDPAGNEGTGSAQLWARAELDGCLLDYPYQAAERPIAEGWVRQQLSLNSPQTLAPTGQPLPAEFQEVGMLRKGTWNPDDADFDSRTTWRSEGNTIHVRLPWSALGVSDPSSKQALTIAPSGEVYAATAVPVDQIPVVVEVDAERADAGSLYWVGWDQVGRDQWTHRLTAGADEVTDLLRELSQVH